MTAKIITLEEQEKIVGGGNDCLDTTCSKCDWQYTGNEREGWWFFFWTKHEKEQICPKCHHTRWIYED